MKVDVKVAGASYSGVPAILLPLEAGGKACFCEVSDTTAVASDVASGKTFYTADGKLATGTSTGEGGSTVSGLPTYTITLPETEHQTVSLSVGYTIKTSVKALSKTGTVCVSDFIDANPVLRGISVSAESGYIAGKISPVLTYPYEVTEDLVFSITDASEATFIWPDSLTLHLGELSAGANGNYYTFATSSQSPEIPLVTFGFSDGLLLLFTDQASNYGTVNLSGKITYPTSSWWTPITFDTAFTYNSTFGCLAGACSNSSNLFPGSSGGLVVTITRL